MTHDIDQSLAQGALREYRFTSHTPLIGPLIARGRSAWYTVAARWGDQSIISQQTAYNAEFDQRIILADHDLINLTRTVAELSQQVIELRHMIEEMQVVRTQS
jgi:hypothetical protein